MSAEHPLRIFGWSIAVTVASIIAAYIYGGWKVAILTLILGIMEVTLSFDNAVVNAKVLERMNEWWQKIFLTVGIVVAVFGMRLVFPLLIVGITAHLNPVETFTLAFEKRPIEDPTSYAALLQAAHPQIAAFGGMFLLLLFLDWVFEKRDIQWLTWLERPLARIGKLDQLSVVIAGLLLFVFSQTLAHDSGVVLGAGVLGIITYLVVNGLGNYMESREEAAEEAFEEKSKGRPSDLVKATGKAAFFLFLYLEVLDASFSFDGVVGAFAITPDPIIIALGLGLIGAMFVRSLTVFFVRKGTLSDYAYLEHGAHWAIGALAVILLVSMGVHIPEVVTGLIGLVLIAAAFVSSIFLNKRSDDESYESQDDTQEEPRTEPVSMTKLG
jgi:hypothetical protein